MNSICFCSILKPYLNCKPDFLPRWGPNPIIKPIQLFNFQHHGKFYGFKAVHNDGVGVLYSDDTVSERVAALDAEPEGQGQGQGQANGVAGTVTEGTHEQRTQIRLKKEEAKKGNVEESDEEGRFKLRNGREVFAEKAYLVGVAKKGDSDGSFGIEESLSELEQLADTAGLLVVGSTYQKQLRNLEKTFGGDVRVCDRTALILDIFNQRAATREAALQAICL
ncbi:UNVERIFIED_CONTAM: hypothetical protein Sradi_2416900 [Sesamum radiatum]|uniref:GTPase HflX N-terminal domain-containing protein n=1 Tax=Sesamum radiatum TaxID=300843 RepID=A0AAW2SHB4_SESRA